MKTNKNVRKRVQLFAARLVLLKELVYMAYKMFKGGKETFQLMS